MSELKVGNRVQLVNELNTAVRDGVLVSITPSKRVKPNDYWRYSAAEKEEMITYATVTFDDGEEVTLNFDLLEPQDSQLERQFRNAFFSVREQIQQKVDEASVALAAAVKLSEEHGIPFNASVSPLAQPYHPGSLETKFKDLDKEFVYAVTNTYSEYGYGGWEHSDVC